MNKPPKAPLPTAKGKMSTNNGNKKGTFHGTNNGNKKGTFHYIPRQVILSNKTDLADNNNNHNNSSITQTISSLPKESKSNVFAANNGGSGNSRKWSPLMDGIIGINVPTSVTGNSSLPNGETPKGLSEEVNDESMMLLDKYIDKILYGSGKRPSSVFEELFRK